MSVKNFDELYVEELRDLYSAERQLIAALPKVAKNVTDPKLQKAVEDHLQQTKGQVERLEKIFESLGEKPGGHKCKAMAGLIEEADELIEDVEKGPLLDAALIGAAQKVEHYEIAGYGTARTFAEMVGKSEHAMLLQETLDEERTTDENLTAMATSKINAKAEKVGATA